MVQIIYVRKIICWIFSFQFSHGLNFKYHKISPGRCDVQTHSRHLYHCSLWFQWLCSRFLTWLFLSIPFCAGCGAMFLTLVFSTSYFNDILKQTLRWRGFWKMTLPGFWKMVLSDFWKMALSGFWKRALSSFLKMALPGLEIFAKFSGFNLSI